MKRTLLLVMAAALVMAACVIPGIPAPVTEPTIDVAATSDSVLQTASAGTLTARPSETSVLPTGTATATEEPALPTDSPTPVETPTADLTTTPATSTPGLADPAATPTLASIQLTSIPTLTIRTYGTLPPAVPFSQITLVNRSKTQAYISLQVTSADGRYAILEYPVETRVDVRAPVGSYLYVAWVGGRKMVGNFRLHGDDELTITLFKDKVVIK